jgi:branched-chain amino acid transport system permease protein
MDLSIAALLAQDGITNGAIYALLSLALVLVFAVTRVIFVPAGEFVTYGTLTLASLQLGKSPGTVGLLIGLAASPARWSSTRRRAIETGAGCPAGWRSIWSCRWRLPRSFTCWRR